jgi:hypothetical protein
LTRPTRRRHKQAHAPVAQLDRAAAFEAAGRGFDSLQARQQVLGMRQKSAGVNPGP